MGVFARPRRLGATAGTGGYHPGATHLIEHFDRTINLSGEGAYSGH